MAKISRHLHIAQAPGHYLQWKGTTLCQLIALPEMLNSQSGSAFIVASGPSVKQQNIQPLQTSATFGINGSFLKFADDGITPRYYVISDEEFVEQRFEIVKKILDSGCHCLFTPSVLSQICTIDLSSIKDHPAISVFYNHFKEYNKPALTYSDIVTMAQHDSDIITKDGKIGFSKNLSKGVFTAHTVIYFALQLAYGIGFRTIYLLGMDLGAGSNQTTRFYEGGDSAMPSHLGRDYQQWILPSFEIVSRLCEESSLQVYNLSKDSRLPDTVIPKNTLEWAINNCRNK